MICHHFLKKTGEISRVIVNDKNQKQQRRQNLVGYLSRIDGFIVQVLGKGQSSGFTHTDQSRHCQGDEVGTYITMR
jgi:hypothetical protein